jgi:prepilin peptidase CpaA
MIPLPIYLFVLIELAFVSYGDIRTNKIPNMWSIINIIAFLILLFVAPDFYVFTLATFTYSIAFLAVGFALFLFKIMGGGDTKYLFSLFLLIPISLQGKVFYYLLISTIIIGGFLLIQNTLKNFKPLWRAILDGNTRAVKSFFGTKFSYAPVILVTWLWIGFSLRNEFF